MVLREPGNLDFPPEISQVLEHQLDSYNLPEPPNKTVYTSQPRGRQLAALSHTLHSNFLNKCSLRSGLGGGDGLQGRGPQEHRVPWRGTPSFPQDLKVMEKLRAFTARQRALSCPHDFWFQLEIKKTSSEHLSQVCKHTTLRSPRAAISSLAMHPWRLLCALYCPRLQAL